MSNVRPPDRERAQELRSQLDTYETAVGQLPGLKSRTHGDTLIARLLESDRRNRYFELVRGRQQPPGVADPQNGGFDPHRAAIYHLGHGSFDEAGWLVFLSVHFGKHLRAEWRYARDVYGSLGGTPWEWSRVSSDVGSFRTWLEASQGALLAGPGPRGFGNHRKYQSLNAWGPSGTGEAVAGYVAAVAAAGGHTGFLTLEPLESSHDAFERIYQTLRAVPSFGRLASFDYVNHARNLGLTKAVPGKAYLKDASGPLRGARLLFAGSPTAGIGPGQLETRLAELNIYLQLGFDVLEDSLCNWQKSPTAFRRFRG